MEGFSSSPNGFISVGTLAALQHACHLLHSSSTLTAPREGTQWTASFQLAPWRMRRLAPSLALFYFSVLLLADLLLLSPHEASRWSRPFTVLTSRCLSVILFGSSTGGFSSVTLQAIFRFVSRLVLLAPLIWLPMGFLGEHVRWLCWFFSSFILVVFVFYSSVLLADSCMRLAVFGSIIIIRFYCRFISSSFSSISFWLSLPFLIAESVIFVRCFGF